MPTSVQSFVIQIANMLYLKFCAFQQQGSVAWFTGSETTLCKETMIFFIPSLS